MQTILDEVESITDMEGLGLALGIYMTSVQKIMESSSQLHQKREIIWYWLTRKDIIPSKCGQVPNWSLLVEAVNKENPIIAQTIHSKYCNKPL